MSAVGKKAASFLTLTCENAKADLLQRLGFWPLVLSGPPLCRSPQEQSSIADLDLPHRLFLPSSTSSSSATTWEYQRQKTHARTHAYSRKEREKRGIDDLTKALLSLLLGFWRRGCEIVRNNPRALLDYPCKSMRSSQAR